MPRTTAESTQGSMLPMFFRVSSVSTSMNSRVGWMCRCASAVRMKPVERPCSAEGLDTSVARMEVTCASDGRQRSFSSALYKKDTEEGYSSREDLTGLVMSGQRPYLSVSATSMLRASGRRSTVSCRSF